jgi:uncharacterized protein (UPF0335 family)
MEGHNAQGALRDIVDRIERLEGEKADIAADISAIKKEAKRNGFNVRAINTLVRERRQDQGDLEALNEVLDYYRTILGVSSPL